MKYLVEIFDHVEKIYMLKDMMANDPTQSNYYEKEMWVRYTKVTRLKDEYYEEKAKLTPHIKNAYVTFRSQEGKARAKQAYAPSIFVRLFAEVICCMPNVFHKRKLLQTGFY